MGQLKLSQRECESEHLADVANAHERMQELINDLLALAGKGEQVQQTEPIMLSVLVKDC